MASFKNLTVEEVRMLDELRNVDGSENMYDQQIESNILNVTSAAFKTNPRP